MINNFNTDFVFRACNPEWEETLKAMGYDKPTFEHIRRFQYVLDDPELGLSDEWVDGKYDGESFLRAICQAIGLDMARADHRINQIKKDLEEDRKAFKPYIWVETCSACCKQPIDTLAMYQYQLYIDFVRSFWRSCIDWQLGHAQNRVIKHVKETGGSLGDWGHIKQYWFFYKEDSAYVLALNGEVIDKREGGFALDQPHREYFSGRV
jgi:hypothetical protein